MYFDWSEYKFSTDESDSNFRKYTTTGATLELEDDAAHTNMGGDWHIPTPEQCQELIDNTTSEWITQDGVNGRSFTSTKDNSKSIFIPAAGIAQDDSVLNSGNLGSVWSSMLDTDDVYSGQALDFLSGVVLLSGGDRYIGHSLRGVIG